MTDRTPTGDPADSIDAYSRLLDELEDYDEEDEADV